MASVAMPLAVVAAKHRKTGLGACIQLFAARWRKMGFANLLNKTGEPFRGCGLEIVARAGGESG